MGFFDKVKDALTTSDAERRAGSQEEPAPAAGGAAEQLPPEGQETGAGSAEGDVGADAGPYRTVTVQKGDTLSDIAARHGVTWQDMASLNGLDNPDLIYPGQVFKVPHA